MDETNEQKQTFKEVIWDIFKSFALTAIVVFGVVRPFFAEPYLVDGVSMYPTYFDNDYLIVEKLSKRFSEVRRGDVIVLKYPNDPSKSYVKRVVGLPGEKIRFENGKTIIYNLNNPEGQELPEKYLPEGVVTVGQQVITDIPDGQYFVMGDNRSRSSDSRDWGLLPKDNIVGKAFFRVFPLNRLGALK